MSAVVEKNTLSCDWLAFTYKIPNDALSLGFDQWESFKYNFPEFDDCWSECVIMDSRGSFYDYVLAFNDNCRFQYSSVELDEINLGVNVSVPSHGLEWLFGCFHISLDDPLALSKLLSILFERNCKLSRLDLCYDDYSKTFRPKQYMYYYLNGQIITKFRMSNFTSSESDKGHTWYLGSRRNGKILRVYDKDYQSHGEKDCVRYEFELHRDAANDFAMYIIEHGSIDFADYILTWFRVTEDSNDSCKSRRPLLPEWEDWLKNHKFNEQFQPIIIPHYNLQERTEDVTYWFYHGGVLNELKGFISVFGMRKLLNLLDNSAYQVPKKYKDLASHFFEVDV